MFFGRAAIEKLLKKDDTGVGSDDAKELAAIGRPYEYDEIRIRKGRVENAYSNPEVVAAQVKIYADMFGGKLEGYIDDPEVYVNHREFVRKLKEMGFYEKEDNEGLFVERRMMYTEVAALQYLIVFGGIDILFGQFLKKIT